MNAEEIKKYIADNPNDKDVMAILESHADKRVTQALKTYQERTEAEKLKALETQIAQLQAENMQTRFKSILAEKGIPEQFLEYIHGESEDEISQKADRLLETLNGFIQKGIETGINNRLGGKAPIHGAAPASKPLEQMTPAEIYGSLNTLTKK